MFHLFFTCFGRGQEGFSPVIAMLHRSGPCGFLLVFFWSGKNGLHETWIEPSFFGVKASCQKWLVLKSLATCFYGQGEFTNTKTDCLSEATWPNGARYKDVAWLWGVWRMCVLYVRFWYPDLQWQRMIERGTVGRLDCCRCISCENTITKIDHTVTWCLFALEVSPGPASWFHLYPLILPWSFMFEVWLLVLQADACMH